jgi:hypothetical protein
MIEPSESVIGKSVVSVGPTAPPNREPFNNETLIRYIRNFVVTDDQVRFLVCTLINLKHDCFSP